MSADRFSACPACPACGARFRATAQCSRCGADLSAVMALAARAFLRRREARRRLLAGDVAGALAAAREAQRLAATSTGSGLLRVASVLVGAALPAPARGEDRAAAQPE